jgi:hypothetical protein
VAKPNYQFEKRQRELAKKRKKEEKAQRKTTGGEPVPEQEPQQGDAPPVVLRGGLGSFLRFLASSRWRFSNW